MIVGCECDVDHFGVAQSAAVVPVLAATVAADAAFGAGCYSATTT